MRILSTILALLLVASISGAAPYTHPPGTGKQKQTDPLLVFCERKASWGPAVINDMVRFPNVNQSLEVLEKMYTDLPKEKRPPYFVYVDLQRITRDIYRMKKPINANKVFEEEFRQCLNRGW